MSEFLNLSAASESGASPAPAVQPQKPKRVLLKWSLLVTGALFAFLLWQCGSGLYTGAKTSDVAVDHFHQLLNSEAYDKIYAEADAGFSDPEKKAELLKFLSAVHRKLGRAEASKRGNLNVNATTNGTFVFVNYQTSFDKGEAFESFTFKKSITGDLKLYGYNIQSNAFVLD